MFTTTLEKKDMKDVRTYRQLIAQAERFLKENPELTALTMRLPPKATPRTYSGANHECYGRMPESCPIVRDILQKHLPGDEYEDLRDAIFSDIYSQVTVPFRTALEQVLEQKWRLIRATETIERARRDALTEIPNTDLDYHKGEAVYTTKEEEEI